MQDLIRDLLAYSRVGSRPARPAPCVVSEMIAVTMRDLRARITESGAEVVVGEMPTVVADPTRMRQLFLNLIANAVKFRRPDVRPRIEIKAGRQDGGWLFSVRDNGIGVDPDSCERVFEIFQRLHSHDAYDGTGIGLAICRRIVESHGGRIWCESRGEGQGTTFFFTLPDREGANDEKEETIHGTAEQYG
jgi:light-regulated signal transduction histidine kinase (bacteriophytochrome)